MKQVFLTLFACLVLLPITATGAIYNFVCVPDLNNIEGYPGCTSPNDVSGQLSMDVTANSGSGVSFLFNNVGAVTSIVRNIYVDNLGLLLDFSQWAYVQTAGVSFSNLVSPGISGSFPRGNTLTVPFIEDAEVNVNGQSNNGVNNTATGTESLRIDIALASGKTFNDVIAGLNNGNLRVGLNISGLVSDPAFLSAVSDSYISAPNASSDAVPEPRSYAAVLTVGLAGLYYYSRRRRVV